MQSDAKFLQREVVQLLQRKRKHGRSLTDREIREFFRMGNFEKVENTSSEALLSTSACPGASLSIDER